MDILDDMGVSKLSAKVFFKSEPTPLRTPFRRNANHFDYYEQ